MDFQQRYRAIQDNWADGRIDAETWHRCIQTLLEAAYLPSESPYGQSGSSGDAEHWEQRRRVIAEAIHRDGTFLDVGCANGLLMETLPGWAAARGHRIEPHGLDISPQLAALARRRLPAWADRIHVGNAATWTPPRRYDFVRTELAYVPPGHEPRLISHLIERVVAPGGRLILCAYRPRGDLDAAEIVGDLRAWGWPPGGEAGAVDPLRGGIATRIDWLDAPA
jgi:SAM-dependent methyltransferase